VWSPAVGKSKIKNQIKINGQIKIKSRYPVAVAVSFFASTRAKHSPEQAPAGATNTRPNIPWRDVQCVLSVTKDQKRVIKVWGGWPTPSHLIPMRCLIDLIEIVGCAWPASPAKCNR